MLSKMKTSVVVAALLLAASAYASDTQSAAAKNINVAAIQASLSELPAVEIPARASELMKAASDETKIETAKAILKSVLGQRPQMAIQLVASLVKASPETASQITTLALAIVPQYGDGIIQAAAKAAPQYAAEIAVAAVSQYEASKEQIVKWVALAVPAQAQNVSDTVSRQSNRMELIRFMSGALGQSINNGGSITTVQQLISAITAASPEKQQQVAKGVAEFQRGKLVSELKKQGVSESDAKAIAEQMIPVPTIEKTPTGFNIVPATGSNELLEEALGGAAAGFAAANDSIINNQVTVEPSTGIDVEDVVPLVGESGIDTVERLAQLYNN